LVNNSASGSKIRKDIGGCGLRRGESKGCGCNNKQRLRPYEALYRKMKSDNIRLRHLDFTLTYEEFLEFTKSNKCFYCYAEVYWKEHCVTGFGYNLDRMNNFQGYHKDNLVVCCSRCNMGKRDTFSFEEWYGMTEYFRRNL
jgi:hypothetical protein